MQWKDNSDGSDEHAVKGDSYDEDDDYVSFEQRDQKAPANLSGNPMRYLYWGLGIAVVVLLVMLIFSKITGPAESVRISELEKKIEHLEQQVEKVDGVDEKVTRIWEQAKSFEKFKTRFDRSEASMSLRMDHLAMGLDALQKKTDKTMKKVETLKRAPARAGPPPVKKATAKKTHTVAAGDTLFNISRRYNLSVEKLRSMNQLTDRAVIHVGQILTVSSPGG